MVLKSVFIIAIAVIFVTGIGLSINVSAEEKLVPAWIKNTVAFWVDGQVSDTEFLNAVEYLADQGIIQVSAVSETPQIYVTEGGIVVPAFGGSYDANVSAETMCLEENDRAVSATYGTKPVSGAPAVWVAMKMTPIGNPPTGYQFEAQNLSEYRGYVITYVTCMK